MVFQGVKFIRMQSYESVRRMTRQAPVARTELRQAAAQRKTSDQQRSAHPAAMLAPVPTSATPLLAPCQDLLDLGPHL